MPLLARYALALCLLFVVAAVVAFVRGNLIGIAWVLLAGLASNMWWYSVRRARLAAAERRATAPAAGPRA
jgi:hypothetical protein